MSNHLYSKPIYGWGKPPFSWIIKYYGRPLYKISRRNDLPKWASLAVAYSGGSALHSSPGLFVSPEFFAGCFIAWEVFLVGLAYSKHGDNKKAKHKGQDSTLETITIKETSKI